MSNTQIVMGFISIITLLLLALSIVFVDSGSIGAVFRFGKFRRVLRPGLGFIIPLLESVERFSTQTHQHEFPDEPENIDRTSDVLLEGKKHPFRILQSGLKEASFWKEKDLSDSSIASDRPSTRMKLVKYANLDEATKKSIEDEEDSLHAPLTSEVSSVVEWYLKSGREDVSNFIENVIPEKGRTREEEVQKRIEDTVSTALQELLGPITLGHAREMIAHLGLLLKERLEVLAGGKSDQDSNSKPLGIGIRKGYIKSIDPGRTVNKARADAAASVSQKQNTIRAAEARAQATRLQADAEKEAEILKGKGEAGRIEEMAKVMTDENARFIAALDVAEQVLPKANTIIVPVGGMDAIASVIALGQNLVKKSS